MSFYHLAATFALSSLALLPSARADTTYAISPSSYPDLCLAPSGETDGSKLVLADCDTADNIAFSLSGSTLVNTETNMCIDVTDGGDWSGNKLQFWECFSGNTNQEWGLSGNAITWNGMCMDLTDGNGAVGTKIQIWSCFTQNTNQMWTFTEIEEVGDDSGDDCDSTTTVASTSTVAVTASATNATVAVTSAVTASGTAASSAITSAVTASATDASSSVTDFYSASSATASASASVTASANSSDIGGELWGHQKSSSSSADSWSTASTTSTDDWSATTSTSSKGSWETNSTTSTDSWGTSSVTASVTASSAVASSAWGTATASSSSSAASSTSTGATSVSGILQTSGTKVVDTSGNEVILRGPNIGGWLVSEDWMNGITDNSGNGDRFAIVTLEGRFGETETAALFSAWYDNYMTTDDFTKIADMGFNSIRLPFGFRNLQNADGSWRSDAFDRLDWAIAAAKAAGLYVIPVFHIWDTQQESYSLISENSDAGQTSRDAAGEIWKKVAAHYIDETAIAAYDAINEPTGSWGDLLQQDLYTAIRSVDANRIIIMESISTDPTTYGWTNVMYSMHEYLMMAGDSSQWSGAQSDINTWNGYNIPTYIGEFMAHADDGTLSTLLDEVNSNNVWWSFWSWKTINMGGWGMYNFPSNQVDVQNDSYDTIMSAWSNLGTASQNTDIYSMYKSAAGGSTSVKKREAETPVERTEGAFVKVTERAGEIPTRRLPGSHRRSRRYSGHSRSF